MLQKVYFHDVVRTKSGRKKIVLKRGYVEDGRLHISKSQHIRIKSL